MKPADIMLESPDYSPYSGLIEDFIAREFPGVNLSNKSTLLEVLTSALIASKDIRYAPIPKPESLVAIREVIRTAIEANEPIPALTLWGSVKYQRPESIDIAELSALRQLSRIQSAIKQYYEPGLQLNMRLEDTSGFFLFNGDPDIETKTFKYLNDLECLISVLGLDFIKPMRESTMLGTSAKYHELAKTLTEPIYRYIVETDKFPSPSKELTKSLADIGWTGTISPAQRDYYRQTYQKLYPNIAPEDATMKMARYFASALARVQLKITGEEKLQPRIRLTFVPPVPGAPESLFSRNLYYRTIPMSSSRNHIPPWRAKGYLRIVGNEVIPKLISWHDPIINELEPNTTKVARGNKYLTIRSDYFIEK